MTKKKPAGQPKPDHKPVPKTTNAPPPPNPVSGSGPSGPIKPRVSKAGPVPTRVGSGMLVSQRTADATDRATRARERAQPPRPVNWATWRHVAWLKVWEAVALSLDIDPDKVEHHPDSWVVQNHLFKESQEFTNRVFIACRKLASHPHIADMSPDARIDRLEFLRLALSVAWEIPDELAAFAETAVGGQQPEPMFPGGRTWVDDEYGEEADDSQSEAKQTTRRRDILSPIIERAIAETDGSTSAVYIWLKEHALNETPPLTGVDDDGAILYADSKNKQARLTRDALDKRLKRASPRQ